MPFGREILLRNVKYALRRVGFISFHLMQSIKFHNFCKKLFHINEVDISLMDILYFIFICYNQL